MGQKNISKKSSNTTKSFYEDDFLSQNTKIIINQKGEELIKIGLVCLDSQDFSEKLLTTVVRQFLNQRYVWNFPFWSFQLRAIFHIMKQSRIQQINVQSRRYDFKKKSHNFHILNIFTHIKFSYLRKIQIELDQEVNIQQISWIQMSVIQQIYIKTKNNGFKTNSLAKCNFPYLAYLVITHSESQYRSRRNIEVSSISRIKMWQKRQSQVWTYNKPWKIDIFRSDLSNISKLVKIQLQSLSNLHISQLQINSQLKSFNIIPIVKAMMQKFMNTIYVKRFYDLKSYQHHAQQIYCWKIQYYRFFFDRQNRQENM